MRFARLIPIRMAWTSQIELILQAAQTALGVAVLLLLPGLAWTRRLDGASELERIGAALVIGLPAAILPAVLLAEAGLFSAQGVWLSAGLIALIGIKRRGGIAPGAGRPFILFAALLFALLLTPPRSEWILGGWDPGVNMNQGLLISRSGAVAQDPDPVIAGVLHATRESFTRMSFGFVEAFPGIPIDPDTGAYRPYFYRATPAWIAVLDQLAGRAAALRANQISACIAAVLFAGFLGSAGIRIPFALAGGVLLLLNPIVIAHHGDPASEMLELAVVCGAGFQLARSRTCTHAISLLIILLLGALNRVSFLFHIALLLSILAIWEAGEDDRSSVSIRHLAAGGALTIGLAWYTWITPESLIKVRHLLPALHTVIFASVGLTLLVDVGSALLRSAGLAHVLRGLRATRAAALLVPVGLLTREAMRSDAWSEFLRNLPAWFAYAPPLLAGVGGIGSAWRGVRSSSVPWLLWTASALLTVLLHRHAAELYPWATKRWLAWSPPFLLAGAVLLAERLSMQRIQYGRALGWALLGGIALGVAPLSYSAWNAAEHRGALRALEQLAVQLRPDDLVVADHFRWATPLALTMGFRALNAEPMLAGLGDAHAAARGLAESNRRVILFTSTKRGLDAWPNPFRTARPLQDPIRLETRERIQHRSHRAFQTRARDYTLQLHEWEPPR